MQRTYAKRDPVLIEGRNLRTAVFTARKGESLAAIQATRLGIGLSSRYAAYSHTKLATEDQAAA